MAGSCGDEGKVQMKMHFGRRTCKTQGQIECGQFPGFWLGIIY